MEAEKSIEEQLTGLFKAAEGTAETFIVEMVRVIHEEVEDPETRDRIFERLGYLYIEAKTRRNKPLHLLILDD